MSGPFKMKGSPMQRNFGIGASPMKQAEGEKKKVKIEHEGSTEYVKGGRKGDKTTKSTEYRPQTEGGRVIKTVRKKDKSGNVTRDDKSISKTRAWIEKGFRNITHRK
jgi:hypothetical protein